MIETTPAAKVYPTSSLKDLALKETLADPAANDLDQDAFLKLLVAQLRFQDPLNPSDPAEFMATTAQFTTIEKLDQLTKQGETNAIVTGLSMASSLVGREVEFVGADDVRTTATVNSAQVVNGEIRLISDAGSIDMASVVGIGNAQNSLGKSAENSAENGAANST